jgi:hypothetical protein
MDILIVGIIVAIAVFFSARSVIKIFTGEKSCGCGGGCACSGEAACEATDKTAGKIKDKSTGEK